VVSDRPGTLLTGATGFVGGEVLARLLERQDTVYALIRAGDDDGAQARLDGIVGSLSRDRERPPGRAVAVAADVAQPALGLDQARAAWLAERVTRIIHCAASVSFTLPLEPSCAINVEGTRRMLDLAELCMRRGGLECFTHVSTAYVAGTHAGEFAERDLDLGQGFRNPYERSKFEAERIARERARSVPIQIVRPSIVVGDSRTGWTASFNVLYAPLRAFVRGAYPVIPARRSSPVDVVPVDYVADAIVALGRRPGTYHLAAGARASSVGELIDLASLHTRRPAPRVVPPRVYLGLVHPVLVRTGSEARRRALRRSEVYFPYFAMDASFDDDAARTVLGPLGIEVPPLSEYFERLIRFAQQAEWGRRPLARDWAEPALEAGRTLGPERRRRGGGAQPASSLGGRTRPATRKRSVRSRLLSS
jgi:long-chain acyl-CoA synthetase